jgi:hypothetical protein
MAEKDLGPSADSGQSHGEAHTSAVEGAFEKWLRDTAGLRLEHVSDSDVEQNKLDIDLVIAYESALKEAEELMGVRQLSQAALTGRSATPHAGWQRKSRFLTRSLERLPLEDRERYAEEWAADLEAIDGRFARWRWRLGIRLTARRIAKPGKATAHARLSNS